jgi:hypothetical protein
VRSSATAPQHVVLALATLAPAAKKYAPRVRMDPRVALAQWVVETGWLRSALFLGGTSIPRVIPKDSVPTYNLAGMVRHAAQFEGPEALYAAGKVWPDLAGGVLMMPASRPHHDGRQNWPAFASLDLGARAWAVRILASPSYGDLRATLRRQVPMSAQAHALGISGWAQSQYKDGARSEPGSKLIRIITEWRHEMTEALG